MFIGTSAFGKVFTALKLFFKESWGVKLFSQLGNLKKINIAGIARVIWRSLGIVRGAIMATLPAIWSFTAALLANPITWVVGACIAFAGVAYLIWKNWDTIGPKLSKVWEGLKTFFVTLFVDPIIGGLNAIWQTFVDVFTKIANRMPWLKKAWDWAGSALGGNEAPSSGNMVANARAISPAGARGNVYTVTYSPNINVDGAADPAATRSNVSTAAQTAADDFFRRYQDHTSREQRLSYGF